MVFAFMIIVVPLQLEPTEKPLDQLGFAALARFPGLGLVGRIDAIGASLEKKGDQFAGGLENDRPD